MTKGNWATINARAKIRRNGYEPTKEGDFTLPAHALSKARNGANEARVQHYLAVEDPGGERNVAAVLDTPSKRKRNEWLRGILDCCED